MEFQGTNFKLRPWIPSDLESLVKYANNKNVSRCLRDRFPFPYTKEDGEKWINVGSKTDPQDSFAVEINGEAVGGVGLMPGSDTARLTSEIGYWLGEPFWGKGIATEALKILTQYALETRKFIRVYAGVLENNPASARVLEKAGYVLESRQKKATIKNGVILDQFMYVIFQEN
jgi:[ribosomal protein S5]-alanine N-acetyltransferase